MLTIMFGERDGTVRLRFVISASVEIIVMFC